MHKQTPIEIRFVQGCGPYYYLQYRTKRTCCGVWSWIKYYLGGYGRWKSVYTYHKQYGQINPFDETCNPDNPYNWDKIYIEINDSFNPEERIKSLRGVLRTYGDLRTFYKIDISERSYQEDLERWKRIKNMKKIY